MDWRFLSHTNITELQRVDNMCETRNQEFDHDLNDYKRRTTALESSLHSPTERYKNTEIEQLEQQLLSEKKELSKLYTGLLNERGSEIWKLKRRNHDLEQLNKELTKDMDELEIEHQEALRAERTQFEACRRRLSHEEANSKTLQERMSMKDYELGKLQEELKDKTERLASIFQRRLKHDQRKVENAAECNNPSDVEKDFKSFFDGPRIDACETIENTLCSETDIDTQIRYLACIIFVTAYEQVEEARGATCDFFNNITRQLIDEAPRKSQELCIKRKEDGYSSTFRVMLEVSVERKEMEDSRDIVDSLMLSLKQTAHLCDLKCFEKDVKQKILQRWTNCLQEEQEMPLLPTLSEEVILEVDDYIKACIRLSWKIVTQVPPLRLEYNSLKFNERMHSLTRLHCNNERSEQGQSENIACYLWPALVEHGGRVIFRGEVLCK